MDFSRFAYKAAGDTSATIKTNLDGGILACNLTSSTHTPKIAVIDVVSPEPKTASDEKLFSSSSLLIRNHDISASQHENIKNSSSSSLSHGNISNAPVGRGLKDLFKSPRDPIEKVLRMIIIGHNPSYQSWSKGHYYANPANRMWPILAKSGIVPRHFNCMYDQDCPSEVGIGFTDVLVGFCETNSSNIDDVSLVEAKSGLYTRLINHCHRVSADNNIPIEEAYPRVIAFAGVRQYKALFDDEEKFKKSSRKRKASESMNLNLFYESKRSKSRLSINEKATRTHTEIISIDEDVNKEEGNSHSNLSLEGELPELLKQEIESGQWTTSSGNEGKTSFGVQLSRPRDWPKLLEKSIVVLLPSTSGAAAMTTEAREGPYFLVGKLLQRLQYDYCQKRGCIIPFWKDNEIGCEPHNESVASLTSVIVKADLLEQDVIVIDGP